MPCSPQAQIRLFTSNALCQSATKCPLKLCDTYHPQRRASRPTPAPHAAGPCAHRAFGHSVTSSASGLHESLPHALVPFRTLGYCFRCPSPWLLRRGRFRCAISTSWLGVLLPLSRLALRAHIKGQRLEGVWPSRWGGPFSSY